MPHRLVRLEKLADIWVKSAVIRVQPQLANNVFAHDFAHRFLVGNGDMESADVAAALHKRKDRALVGWTSFATLSEGASASRLSANFGFFNRTIIGFVRLDNFAFAAERAKAARPHRFADAVTHEPRRLVIEVEGAMELMRAHAFFEALSR